MHAIVSGSYVLLSAARRAGLGLRKRIMRNTMPAPHHPRIARLFLLVPIPLGGNQ